MSDALIHRPAPLPPDEQFAANLQYMTQIQPSLAAQTQAIPLPNLHLGQNPDGYFVGNAWSLETQEWVPMCVGADPWGEAETDATAMWKPEIRVFIVLGLGLGYLASALAQRLLPHQRLAVFEPRIQHYAATARALDMADLLGITGKRVDTFLGDGLDQNMRHYYTTFESAEKFGLVPPIMCGFATKCDVETYQHLVQVAGEMHRYQLVGLETWKQFGPLIGDNDLGNLPEFCAFPGLDAIKDCWKGKPAICVAAGPSLQKNLHLLTDPALRKRAAVLTVGTTYALLRALGISPDATTTIDFQELNWTDQFQHVPLDDAPPLVYLHSTWPETVRRWPGARFVTLNGTDTTGWMQQYTESKPHAAQVQTVAHLNLALAYAIGADPIVLIGQDLSMPATEHHAPGARVQDAAPQDCPDSHVEAEDIHGRTVYSRHSFLSMRTVFEQLIAQSEGCTVLNCTEGGLAIKGAENTPLAEVLQGLPVQKQSLRQIMEQAYNVYTPQTKWDEMQAALGKLQDDVETLYTLATDLLAVDRAIVLSPSDVLPEEQALLERGEAFKEYPLAFGQFAVRDFAIIEAVGKVPPYTQYDAEPTPRQMATYNRMRLRALCEAIVTHRDTVHALVGETRQRFDDVLWARNLSSIEHISDEQIDGMFARQSFHAIELYLQKRQGVEYLLEHYKRLFLAQQRYHAASVVAELNSLPRDKDWHPIEDHEEAMQELRRLYFAASHPASQLPKSPPCAIFTAASAIIPSNGLPENGAGLPLPEGEQSDAQREGASP